MKQKSVILIINLILLQILSIILVSSLYFFRSMKLGVFSNYDPGAYSSIMISIVIIVSFLTIYLVKELFYLSIKEIEVEIANQKLIDSQEMIQTLKANQHDFINHLQVISLAAQMGDTELINRYTKRVVKQVRELDILTNLKYPEVAALLYSKMAEAEDLEIKVNISVNTTLQGIKVASTELVRILGNLLNNAIDALQEVEVAERYLHIMLFEDEEKFKFEITNQRPIIPLEVITKLFIQGFTTKGEKGNGFGLFNVKKIVDKYHGEVNVLSNIDTGTIFKVLIPKL